METATYSDKYQNPATAECYDNVICDAEGSGAPFWSVEQRLLERLIARHCPNHRQADALDFACGTGRILLFVRPRVKSLVGVDISQAMLDRASSKVNDTRLICADIVNNPNDVPGEKDLITSFRFLLLSGEPLRTKCISALATKLRGGNSILILNSHGNPRSFRALANLKNKLFKKSAQPLPAFSMKDMRALAERCGLEIVAASGLGFVPNGISKLLPPWLYRGIERILCGRPLIWRFGSDLMFVCRKKA
jgi:predicted TPR repeat methyltransferase